jgi:hypothetical protein
VAGLDTSADFSVFISSEAVASDGSISASVGAVDTSTLGLTSTDFSTVDEAQAALAEVQGAIDALGDVQNTIGTLENRLGFAIGLATSQVVNKKAAESRIRAAKGRSAWRAARNSGERAWGNRVGIRDCRGRSRDTALRTACTGSRHS